jgi:hypothetical protein
VALTLACLNVAPWEFFNVIIDERASSGIGVLTLEQPCEKDCEVFKFVEEVGDLRVLLSDLRFETGDAVTVG